MNWISNRILLSKALNLILRFQRRDCKESIIEWGIVRSDPSKLLVNLNLKYCIWRKKNLAYFWCDLNAICDKQKTMSKVVTRMSPRYFVESNQVCSKVKLLNNSSWCRLLDGLDPMSSYGHERYLIRIWPRISGAGYFPHWFLNS